MFGISFSEITLVAVVALIVVGPQKLPGMLRTLGEWLGKLRRLTSDVRAQTGIDDLLREEGIDGVAELRSLLRGEGLATRRHQARVNLQHHDPYAEMVDVDPLAEYPAEGPDLSGAIPDDLCSPELSEANQRPAEAQAPASPDAVTQESAAEPLVAGASGPGSESVHPTPPGRDAASAAGRALADAEPVDAEPVDAEPVDAEPVETEETTDSDSAAHPAALALSTRTTTARQRPTTQPETPHARANSTPPPASEPAPTGPRSLRPSRPPPRSTPPATPSASGLAPTVPRTLPPLPSRPPPRSAHLSTPPPPSGLSPAAPRTLPPLPSRPPPRVAPKREPSGSAGGSAAPTPAPSEDSKK